MDEKRGWLEKVLDDVTADVESWPTWLRDDEGQNCAANDSAREVKESPADQDSARRLARGA
jgi:hypothetical protein